MEISTLSNLAYRSIHLEANQERKCQGGNDPEVRRKDDATTNENDESASSAGCVARIGGDRYPVVVVFSWGVWWTA